MNAKGWMIFLSVVLVVYGGGAFYSHRRLASGLTLGSWRLAFSMAFLLLTLAYPASRFLSPPPAAFVPQSMASLAVHVGFREWLATCLNFAGSVWMAVLIYLALGCGLWDLAQLFFRIPGLARLAPQQAFNTAWASWGALGLLGLTAVLLAVGALNAAYPRLNVMTLDLDAPAPDPGIKELRVGLVTDIHMGRTVGRSHLLRMNKLLAEFNPDVTILGGDQVDEDMAAVLVRGLDDLIQAIPRKKALVAVTGNHEHFHGADEACAYLKQMGVIVLRDQRLTLDSGVVIMGREDRVAQRFGKPPRAGLEYLTRMLKPETVKILVDHQPMAAKEFEGWNLDLILSGHTHDGQMWPFSFITPFVFEHAIGLRRVGRTWQYVSPGFGTWGPPIRIGRRPEVAGFVLRFKDPLPVPAPVKKARVKA
jgi:predicted MPP superfamily phosphohydrolase